MDFIQAFFADAGVQEAIIALVGIALTIIANRAAGAFTAATGIRIEEKHMRVLHEGVRTSVEATVRHGVDIGLENLRDHVVTHLRRSAPDALRALLPDFLEKIVPDTVLDNLIERYRGEAVQKLGLA